MNQREVVAVRVPCETVTLSETGRVELPIETEIFGDSCTLHRADDVLVVFGIGADEIDLFACDEVRIGSESADIFGLESERGERLAEFSVTVGRDAAVAIGVLAPGG